jgi:hypothetical protein
MLPSGVLLAQQNIARKATMDASSGMAAEQAVQTQNMYVELAKMSIDSWLKAAELQMESEIKAYVTFSQSRQKTAEMEMQGYMDRAKVAIEALGLRIDLTKAAGSVGAQYRLGVNQALNGLVAAYGDLARTGADGQAKVAESQRAIMMAMADYWRASIASSDITLRGDIENNRQSMDWAHEAAQVTVAAVGQRVQAAIASADAYGKIAAMAISGLNGIGSVVTQTTS